ncbi:MAG: FtsX-like permease family protein [Acidimicrobiia bacterium]|nr:FtsX-like permease family protein [Acidimicrobiia bacterium]
MMVNVSRSAATAGLLALKGLRANILRFTLTALSVVLGVAFVAGSFVFTDTITARFEALFTDVYAGVDASVRPDGKGAGGPDGSSFDESVLEQVLATDGVADAAGAAAGYAQLIAADGTPIGGQGPPTLGFSWVDVPALSILRIDDGNGRPPERPGEITIDIATAEANGFTLGDTVSVQTMAGAEPYTIVGLAGFGTEDNLAGATITAFELSEAQRVFDLHGRFSGIDVIAADGTTPEQLVENLSASLATTAQPLSIVTGEQQTNEELDEFAAGLGFLNSALLAFAGVAVFVGAFVIQNTFRITVAQRTRELALLRALGASRGQVTLVVLVEALVIGLLASAVGVAAGVGLAEVVKAVMGAANISMPDGPLTIAGRTVIVGMAVGVTITVVSVLLPARRASLVAPVAAMGDSIVPAGRRPLRTRTLVGSGLVAAGGGLMVVGLTIRSVVAVVLVGTGAALLFLGAATLAPLFAAPVARILAAPLRGVAGTLARENTIRQPRRTASTASALMIGVALVAFVTIFAASIKASVTESMDRNLTADLVVTSSNPLQPISPVAFEALAEAEGLTAVSPVRADIIEIDGDRSPVTAFDPATINEVFAGDSSVDLSRIGEGLIVTEDVLESRGWTIGDLVVIDYGIDSVSTELVGTYSGSIMGDYLISADVFTRHLGDGPITMTLIALDDGVELEQGRAASEDVLTAFPNLDVETKSETVASAQAEVDQMVGLFSGLLGLALIVALLGIANTLALSIVERTREIGLLRAVGFSRRQVRRMIRSEAVMTALFGAVMGVVIGSTVGFGVVNSLADDGLTVVAVPVVSLAGWMVAAAVAGVIASVGPARKAARLNVLDAIAHA